MSTKNLPRSHWPMVTGRLLTSYVQMVRFALSRMKVSRREGSVLFILLTAPFSYFLGVNRPIKTPFGLFQVQDRADLRATVYGCFKTTFAYLHNLDELYLNGSRLGVVMDIGSNVGDFAIAMMSRASRVYAIEPSSKYSRVLSRNLCTNGAQNVFPIVAAAYESTKQVLLGGEGSNLFIDSQNGTEPVRGIRLDQLMGEFSEGVDVLKMDIQGGELAALRGMSLKLASKSIRLLIVEVHLQRGVDPRAVTRLLGGKGYSLINVDNYLFSQPHLYFRPNTRDMAKNGEGGGG